VIDSIFRLYEQLPETPIAATIPDLARNVALALLKNAQAVQRYLEPVVAERDFTLTIRAVDLFVIFQLLARIIETNSFEFRTIHIAAKVLVDVLKSGRPFYKTSSFRLALQTTIHVAALALLLLLNSQPELAQVTAELILVLRGKFADLYVESLNALLVKGLATALRSPDARILLRAMHVYDQLAQHTQLFVDALMTDDCDSSGFSENVFDPDNPLSSFCGKISPMTRECF
jgi:hypothetical protein